MASKNGAREACLASLWRSGVCEDVQDWDRAKRTQNCESTFEVGNPGCRRVRVCALLLATNVSAFIAYGDFYDTQLRTTSSRVAQENPLSIAAPPDCANDVTARTLTQTRFAGGEKKTLGRTRSI